MSANLVLAFVLTLLFCVAPFSANAAERIVDVDFKGLIRTNELDARKHVTSLEGTLYYPEAVNRDIKSLFKTGLFRDVSVSKESVAGGVKVIFEVQEQGIVESVVFKGNKKIKDGDLESAVTIREHQFLDEGRIAESEQAIRKLYEEKGYYLADIQSRVVPLDTEKNELELTFDIRENREVRIKRISFVGNKVYSDKKLRKEMKTKVKGAFSFVSSSGKFRDDKLDFDVKTALPYFYRRNGYLKVRVGEPQITLTRNKEAIYITIPVYEGDQYTVNKVDVAGDILTTKEEFLSYLKLKPKEIYDEEKVQADTVALTELYGDQAYAFASVYPDIQSDDAAKTADVTYTIAKGRRILIEKIRILGNSVTRDKVIRREIQLVENGPFYRNKMELSKRRLMQLGYFEDVNIAYPRASRDETVDLVVTVKEKNTGSFNIGAGFSSLESFIFTASVQKDNFLGYGLQGSVSASLSKLRQEFSLSMTDRYFLDTRWILSASVYRFSSALNRDFDKRAFGGSLSFGREIFQFFDVGLGYNIEDISVDNFSSQVPLFFQENSSGITSSIISTLSYDTRDNRLTTSKGMYHLVSSTYAGNGVGGDNDFYKISAQSRFFFRMPLKTVFKVRGLVAYVNSLNDDPVPLFERFFLGGVSTLRGYDLNTIGPSLRIPSSPTGGDRRFIYGGNRMVMANAEYELPIYDPAGIRAVVFFDIGQAYGETESIDLASLRSNYGFGFRWNSPFGPLRFEWGFPIGKKSNESPAVFNFTIGQSF